MKIDDKKKSDEGKVYHLRMGKLFDGDVIFKCPMCGQDEFKYLRLEKTEIHCLNCKSVFGSLKELKRVSE